MSDFVEMALPIMFAVLLAAWIDSRNMGKGIERVNRRLDDFRADMNDRFGEISRRLDCIDKRLKAA